jgi:hypothetical protein
MRWDLLCLEPEEQWLKLQCEERECLHEDPLGPWTCRCPVCVFAREEPERFLETVNKLVRELEERKRRPQN